MPGGGATASSSHKKGGDDAGLYADGSANLWGSAKEGEAIELRVPRLAYIATLKRRLARARRFRTLPLALLLFCLYIAAMMSRSGVISDVLTFDRSLLLYVWGTDPTVGLTQPTTLPEWLAYTVGPNACLSPSSSGAYCDSSLAPSILTRAFLSGTLLGDEVNLYGNQGVLATGPAIVVGGAVLSQTRVKLGPCAGGVNYTAFWPNQFSGPPCPQTGVPTHAGSESDFTLLSPYEAGAPFVPAWPGLDGNGSLATETYGAFTATPIPGDLAGTSPAAVYRTYLSAYGDFNNDTLPRLYTLLNAGWVDSLTSSLSLSMAWVNPTLGRVAHTRHSVSMTPGGLVRVSWRVTSILLDPYGPDLAGVGQGHPASFPGLTLGLDIAVIICIVYVTAGALKRTLRACILAWDSSESSCASLFSLCGGCCGGGGGRRGGKGRGAGLATGGGGDGGGGGRRRRSRQSGVVDAQHRFHAHTLTSPYPSLPPPPPPSFLASLLTHMPLESFAVDWFAVGALIAVAAKWATHASNTTLLRSALQALPSLTPSDEGDYTLGIPPTPGPGSIPSTPGGPPPWATVESLTSSTLDSFETFQTSAVIALIALTLLVLKYAAFQTHFGVLGATFARSARDMYHFGVIMVLFMAVFGVWGQFTFGHQLEKYTGGWSMATTLTKFIMYDYDEAGMVGADGSGMVDVFYILFMLGVTNVLLWLFFAVLFDSYSLERARAAHWPSYLSEVQAFVAAIPWMLPTPPWQRRPGGGGWCCGMGKGLGAFGLGGRKTAPWTELIATASTGSLSHIPYLTPEDLSRAHALSLQSSAMLIADTAGAHAAWVYASQFSSNVAQDRVLANNLAAVTHAAEAQAASEYYGLGLPGGPKLPPLSLAAVKERGVVAGEGGEGQGGSSSASASASASASNPLASGAAAAAASFGAFGGGEGGAAAAPHIVQMTEGGGGSSGSSSEKDGEEEEEEEGGGEDEYDAQHPPLFSRAFQALQQAVRGVAGVRIGGGGGDTEVGGIPNSGGSSSGSSSSGDTTTSTATTFVPNPAFHAYDASQPPPPLSVYDQDSTLVWTNPGVISTPPPPEGEGRGGGGGGGYYGSSPQPLYQQQQQRVFVPQVFQPTPGVGGVVPTIPEEEEGREEVDRRRGGW